MKVTRKKLVVFWKRKRLGEGRFGLDFIGRAVLPEVLLGDLRKTQAELAGGRFGFLYRAGALNRIPDQRQDPRPSSLGRADQRRSRFLREEKLLQQQKTLSRPGVRIHRNLDVTEPRLLRFMPLPSWISSGKAASANIRYPCRGRRLNFSAVSQPLKATSSFIFLISISIPFYAAGRPPAA